ncbi:ABC transporter permease subunit [Salininema proteolyticum]|uniref:Sugar ABC transporter permease YjfF n=1 Tax=Salininema proteolyticum TaxID=1607685 RepID=A0ABV8TYJ7_9ACTN
MTNPVTTVLSSAGSRRYVPVAATLLLLAALYAGGLANYRNFDHPQVVANLFVTNAALLIAAVGMTFVILTGGIDLSVGSVMAFSTMACAWLTVEAGVPAGWAVPGVLLFGMLSGGLIGAVIHYFKVQPFIATLVGLFLYRGLTLQISDRDISVRDVEFFSWGMERHRFGEVSLPNITFVALATAVVAFAILHYTRLGRTVYAVGGSEQSSHLMGLPVARAKITVYAISGFCAALAGVVAAFYTKSANPLAGVGFELDAIASVVIGGTLLVGGYGFVLGTVAGVMVLGLISTIIAYQGSLSSWWANMTVGALLLLFILLQQLIEKLGRRTVAERAAPPGAEPARPEPQKQAAP